MRRNQTAINARLLQCLVVSAVAMAAGICGAADTNGPAKRGFSVANDEKAGVLTVSIDGREALAYQYAATWDLTHYHPLNSPSGRNMLVQKTKPYPHHRCFWFADKVSLGDSKPVGFYDGLYSGKKDANGENQPPFRNHIRHVRFDSVDTDANQAVINKSLIWEMDGNKPVLDEHRLLRIVGLGRGQYLMDLTFTVTAGHGDVTFRSDSVHYAWPYLRMNKQFSGASGGVITNDAGQTGQDGTNGKSAKWVDYSKRFDDGAEGLTIFSHPDNGQPHKWLTREYGTFGPRRPDERSGKPFALKRGQKMSQRVGIYVHRGDVKQADVAGMYQRWIKGEL